jgi:hypothetical protein
MCKPGDPDDAIVQAAAAFKESASPRDEPRFYTPDERWHCEAITLPYVTE